MVVQYGQEEFDNNWLELIKHDPVHGSIPVEKRISGNRTVFIYIHEGIPQFITCVRIGNKLTRNMTEVLSDDGYKSRFDVSYAIFYSIFRLPSATLKGAGRTALKSIVEQCKDKGVQRFFTLSPIPSLSDSFKELPDESQVREYLETCNGPVSKFHLSNGAKIHSINFSADKSDKRLNESWGIMVNYDYNFL